MRALHINYFAAIFLAVVFAFWSAGQGFSASWAVNNLHLQSTLTLIFPGFNKEFMTSETGFENKILDSGDDSQKVT